MDEAVTAADANRKFSQILRHVREGKSYIVTSHGVPVARITPATADSDILTAARESLIARLQSQPVTALGERWSRDDLYED